MQPREENSAKVEAEEGAAEFRRTNSVWLFN
jgi:hypothetical protein